MLKQISFLVFLFVQFTFAQPILLTLMGDDAQEDVYAVNLNGSDEYCSIASPTNILPTGEYSMIMWVKPADLTGQQALLTRDSDVSSGWMLYLESNQVVYLNNIAIGSSVTEGGTRTANEWILIVVTQELTPDSVHLYINSASGHTRIPQTSNTTTTAPFNIGRRSYPGYLSFLNGLVGQVQFIDGYALTGVEIDALYNAGGMLNASYGGGTVVAWYKWSGATDAEMLNDHSASGNDLTGNNVTTADQVLIGASYK